MGNFVGYCTVELFNEQIGVTFPMAVMYPSSASSKMEKIGSYSMDVSMDAALKPGIFPLVLISHGSGGSNLGYWTLAHYLACNGFIVGMPEHPFNNRSNNSLEGTVENLVNRPKHIHVAIDWFYESAMFARALATKVSVIGHSMGGYTALALAGGVPTSSPKEPFDMKPQQINVVHDSRINTLVLLAPASIWFEGQGALSRINCPILMLIGEKDDYTGPCCPILKRSEKNEKYMPYGYHGQIILDGLPDNTKIQHRIVKNAGHFSFLSLFPESMTNKAFLPSQDPVGFNRQNFHSEMNAEILDFLLRNIDKR